MSDISKECREAFEKWVKECPNGDDRGLSLMEHPRPICGPYICADSNSALAAFSANWERAEALVDLSNGLDKMYREALAEVEALREDKASLDWLEREGVYVPTIHEHLDLCGRDIPKWLRDEVSDVNLVPPKGARAAIIYKAMIMNMPAPPSAAEVKAQALEDKIDAERYRWLRMQGEEFQWQNILNVEVDEFPSLDEAVDAAMEAKR